MAKGSRTLVLRTLLNKYVFFYNLCQFLFFHRDIEDDIFQVATEVDHDSGFLLSKAVGEYEIKISYNDYIEAYVISRIIRKEI